MDRRDRPENLTVRDYVAQLMQQNYHNSLIDDILRLAYFSRPPPVLPSFWQDSPQRRGYGETLKEIFTERHETGTYSILQPNPLLNAGKDMYDCLTEKARRPLAPCSKCHERRYMDPTDGEDCSKCTNSRQRQMRLSDRNDMDPGDQDE
ncbi:MAG: hypothetical protein GY696_26245, partial [Gammaproteobacteria bacterium]|nr:hypothetical protein [Gammaproteobacteria bacterium]